MSVLPNSHATEFLHLEMETLDQRIAQLENALDTCQECLELESLRGSLRDTRQERDVLQDLIQQQSSGNGVSLETRITQQIARARQQSARLADRWHSGQPTPAAFWDAENKSAFLADLLRRLHTWQDDRAHPAPEQREPSSYSPPPSFPWFEAKGSGSSAPGGSQELRHQIDGALSRIGYPAHHLTITVMPEGQVIVTGHAHSQAQRDAALVAMMEIEAVEEIVSDIEIAAQTVCPVCARNSL